MSFAFLSVFWAGIKYAAPGAIRVLEVALPQIKTELGGKVGSLIEDGEGLVTSGMAAATAGGTAASVGDVAASVAKAVSDAGLSSEDKANAETAAEALRMFAPVAASVASAMIPSHAAQFTSGLDYALAGANSVATGFAPAA